MIADCSNGPKQFLQINCVTDNGCHFPILDKNTSTKKKYMHADEQAKTYIDKYLQDHI